MIKVRQFGSALVLCACFMAPQAMAAGGGGHLEPADIDPDNVASLQRGARNYMNYCSGCHSAEYVRFNTIGKQLELSEEQLIDNLMFNAEKTFETIRSSMPTKDAERWFGQAPPDLSLMARARGADYIYNFLKGFYVSEKSPTGVDNLVLAGTSMPHVLWELQGYQEARFEDHRNEDGSVTSEFKGFELLSAGSMDPNVYDEFVRDTTNFLAFIAEPIRQDRRTIGVWVLIYLVVFLIIARMLKKQIWKDVE
ncbi:MAG: cytochrome c1 [Gammaproteobacteria bacterium]|nr:cytochrome c1 [Gammaproteobacteria bacterium]NNF49640.1 cytochrome c1 [Woeseiaceae bacterium]MBT8095136.1 cytochrome c1 [Gammaproteobacteria bacterium]MBT8104590.1 cytochrome c1 [Gammaproteobacteria bacterium]NNK24604.1 cytochrome c1 [Woeseiaceae bacterium]